MSVNDFFHDTDDVFCTKCINRNRSGEYACVDFRMPVRPSHVTYPKILNEFRRNMILTSTLEVVEKFSFWFTWIQYDIHLLYSVSQDGFHVVSKIIAGLCYWKSSYMST
jgi:hypothetical protein